MKKELFDNTQVAPLLAPTATPLSDGVTNSLWVSRKWFMSAMVALIVGAAAGAPTEQSVSIKVRTAEDASGTNAVDLLDIDNKTLEAALIIDDATVTIDVDCIGAKDYIGVEVTTTFVGGTTPTIPVNLVAVLADSMDTRQV